MKHLSIIVKSKSTTSFSARSIRNFSAGINIKSFFEGFPHFHDALIQFFLISIIAQEYFSYCFLYFLEEIGWVFCLTLAFFFFREKYA